MELKEEFNGLKGKKIKNPKLQRTIK